MPLAPSILEQMTLSHYGKWEGVLIWMIIFGTFFFFLPYHKKSKTKPDRMYLAFIVASAFEMFGIPLSLYFIAWVFGISVPVGVFWGHTLSSIFGLESMALGYILNFIGGVLIFVGWKEIYNKYWRKSEDDRQLVTGGIYTFSRHPQYLGFILMTFGLLVHWATLPLLIMWPIMVYRYYTLARREENDMLEEFGEKYVEYMSKTAMFFGFPKGSLRFSEDSHITERVRFGIRAVVSSMSLLLIYTVVLSIGNSPSHAILEIIRWSPLLIIQLAGFGLQVSMYIHMRDRQQVSLLSRSASSLTMSNGVSASTMVACCLYYLTDVLPFLGFSAATLLLSSYKYVFMSIGALSNIVGVIYMLNKMQHYSVTLFDLKYARLMSSFDLEKVRNITMIASIVIIAIISASALGVAPFSNENSKLFDVTDTRNSLTFTFKQIASEDSLAFSTTIDTHEDSLSFDLVDMIKIVTNGQVIEPLGWEGSPPGGHHRTGILSFPKVELDADSSFVISGVNGLPDWVIAIGTTAVSQSINLVTYIGVSVTSISAIFLIMRSKNSGTRMNPSFPRV